MMDFKEAAQKVVDGDVDALVTYLEMKSLKKELDLAISIVEDYARDEALKRNEKVFEYKGYKIEVRSGATRYSFKNIPEWVDKNKEMKSLESVYKLAYQSSLKGLGTLNEDEVLKLPEVTSSKESLIIKLI